MWLLQNSKSRSLWIKQPGPVVANHGFTPQLSGAVRCKAHLKLFRERGGVDSQLVYQG